MKARYYTQIHEPELVRMEAADLNFFIHEKIVNEHLSDMSQLAEKVRQIEQIKFEKERNCKFDKFITRDRVVCIKTYNFTNYSKSNQDFNIEYQGKLNIAKLKLGPSHTCQMLKPEESQNKFSNAKYSFDVSKESKIFNILLQNKKIVSSKGHKILQVEQRKGKKIL